MGLHMKKYLALIKSLEKIDRKKKVSKTSKTVKKSKKTFKSVKKSKKTSKTIKKTK